MIQKIDLPTITKTKGEAKALAKRIFPPVDVALNQVAPGTTFPRYQLDFDALDKMNAVLHWIHEQRPKIYKRARWHLFYNLAQNMVNCISENAALRIHEMYSADHSRDFLAKLEAAEAVQTMPGDGYGI